MLTNFRAFQYSIAFVESNELTLYFMLQNCQTYFKILRIEHRKIFKVCLTILQHKTKG